MIHDNEPTEARQTARRRVIWTIALIAAATVTFLVLWGFRWPPTVEVVTSGPEPPVASPRDVGAGAAADPVRPIDPPANDSR